jgi:hypothetical protein
MSKRSACVQVKILIDKDINLLAKDSQGCTALHLAATKGHVNVLLILAAAAGPDLVLQKSETGSTALELAALHGHEEAKEMLQQMEGSMTRYLQEQEEKLKSCWLLAKEMALHYSEVRGSSPLTVEEYREIAYHIHLNTWAAGPQEPATDTKEKFVVEPKDLVCGEFEHAAKGFFKLLNVSENDVLIRAFEGISAIEEEVEALQDGAISVQLHYILKERARERKFPNGVRDKGHAGMRLQDFVDHEYARTAELEEEEVVALRLYTTSAFQQINNPLRDKDRISSGRPHPLPVTVAACN